MKKVDVEKEKLENKEFNSLMAKQEKIRKQFEFLENVNDKHFQSEFIKAQAKEFCDYLTRLKFTPFRALESLFKELLESESYDLMYKLYITTNEYGEYVPDTARADEHILKDPDPEEFPESRR